MSSVEITRTLGPPYVNYDLQAAAAALSADDKDRHMLGTILGKATGLSYRHSKFSDDAAVALTGYFEFIPTDADVPRVTATSLFLPSTVHAVIIKQIEGDRERPVSGNLKRSDKPLDISMGVTVPIVAEISYSKTTGEGGRGYQYHVDIDTKAIKMEDLLADLRGDDPKLAFAGDAVKAIEDKSGGRSKATKRKARR